MFLIPPLACLALLVTTWWTESLSRPVIPAAIVLVGVVTQELAPMYSPLWVAALLLNVVTAIYLSIRLRLN